MRSRSAQIDKALKAERRYRVSFRPSGACSVARSPRANASGERAPSPWAALFRRFAAGRTGVSALRGLESRREMPQKRRLVLQLQSADVFTVLPDLQDDLDHIVDVTLGIDPARD